MGRPHDREEYRGVPPPRPTPRPTHHLVYEPYFMNNRVPTETSTSSYESSGRYKAGRPTRRLSGSVRTLNSDSSDNSNHHLYPTNLTYLADPMLSPGPPDEMHSMGKPPPRKGRSRYIGDPSGHFTLFSKRGCLNLGEKSLPLHMKETD